MRTHTGEKPFECNVCQKKFSEKGNYTIHMRTHTGERPYSCSFDGCHKEFITKGHLVDRERRHTGERPFKCDICEKAFFRSTALKDHIKRHKLKKRGAADRSPTPAANVDLKRRKLTSNKSLIIKKSLPVSSAKIDRRKLEERKTMNEGHSSIGPQCFPNYLRKFEMAAKPSNMQSDTSLKIRLNLG